MHGRKGELLVIASCPGDAHPGQLHSRFSKYDGVWVRFIPVQYSKASFAQHWHDWWSKYFERALAEAQSSGAVNVVKVLAIRGGGGGCAEERSELHNRFIAIPNLGSISNLLIPGLGFLANYMTAGGSTPVQYFEVDPDTAEAYITRKIDHL